MDNFMSNTGKMNILHFNGKWRSYQQRVLDRADMYLKDNKIHIVAAPGSGKTTLGIELIGRIGKPTLVLAPSIAIREQWESRIVEAFLVEGNSPSDYISQDLKNPKLITISTYQALHSAMTGEGKVQIADFGTLCLDECHHLRNEWWSALEKLKSDRPDFTVVALTATPPYDSTPALWNRYIGMCGEIDEEITIPELVKEGSLCPHQDFVYFNYPTKEEEAEIDKFKDRSNEMLAFLMEDEEFKNAVLSHGALNGSMSDDKLLEEPAYLSSLLIYLNEKKLNYPKRLMRLLGVKSLPEMEGKWMEILLQKFLYDDTESFLCDNAYKETLETKLKQMGLVEKKEVTLTTNSAVEKLLTTSKGKSESIEEIAKYEYESMGKNLRMLILTDYIRNEYEKLIGTQEHVNSLGVLPHFEQLRRKFGRDLEGGARLGVLCGSMVIIPAEAKEALIEIVGNTGEMTFSSVGSLSEIDYLKVDAVGESHFLTGAVTELFSQGHMQILIGTKSLLGEGWDCPCINSLILASFVGSYMLSNQMRGRAIRIDKKNPNKTSNIWHLVCLKPKKTAMKEAKETGVVDEESEDYKLLERRMEHFLGLHYEEDIITNHIERLSVIKKPFSKSKAKQMNEDMLKQARLRQELRERWDRSLGIYGKMEVVDEAEVSERLITVTVFYDAIKSMAISFGVSILSMVLLSRSPLGMLLAILFFIIGLIRVPKAFMLGSPLKRLKAFGKGIHKALKRMDFLSEYGSKVEVESHEGILHAVYLQGGSGRDKEVFCKCVSDFFTEIDNQRYILVKAKGRKGNNGFYAVPEIFSKKKEDAQIFAECMEPYIGKYDLVYTRSEGGRALLLEGRRYAYANKSMRAIRHKKVKSALE